MTSLGMGTSFEDAFEQPPGGVDLSPRVSPIAWMRSHIPLAVAPYVVAILAATGAAVAMAERSGTVVWWAVGGVFAALSADFVSLPVYERPRSLRPVRRLLGLGAATLLTATVLGLLAPADVRAALTVIGVAAFVIAGSVAVGSVRRSSATVLLVGGRVGVGQLIGQWSCSTTVEVKGVCLAELVDEAADDMLGVPILGMVENAAEVATGLGVDQVVVAAGPLVSSYDVRRLGWALEGTPIELSVGAAVHGAVPRRVRARLLDHRLLLSVVPGRASWVSVWFKGAVDRVLAAMLLIILAPLFVALTIVIRRDSEGPAFFRQTRTGQHDRPFTMLKFRTMVVDAEDRLADLMAQNEGVGPLFKMVDDPRMTRVGRVLRRTSLDELPQLINVVTGRMSLVGPRPCLPREAQEYDDWERRRLSAKPGMTGAWQVSGRSRLSWQDSVRLDVDYADNRTFTDDLLILAKTVQVVAQREGAM